ncbi:MAG TPA: outer membrane beta-barrel protein, partial [Burkholderiales bacterium]|nr:outer membrane beta-barrel protein [Burkholderiales bacterium]
MKKHATLAAAFTLAGGFSPQLAAQVDWFTESVATPWYVGLGISRGNATPPQGTIDAVDAAFTAAIPGTDNTIRDINDRFNGSRVFLGYEFNRYLAIEAGLTRLGKTEVGYNFRSGVNSVGTLIMNYRMSALYVDAVGKYPIDPKWSLLGRVG